MLHEIVSGKLLMKFTGHTDWIRSAALSPNGQYLLTGSKDGTAILWEMKSGKKVKVLNKSIGGVSSVAFSADGTYLVFAGDGLEVCLWDIKRQETIATFYSYDEGFLWATPPDEAAPSGWFWTDRPECINVLKYNEDGSEAEALADNDPDKVVYINAYNRKDMIVNRLNNPEQYKKDKDYLLNFARKKHQENRLEHKRQKLIGLQSRD
jgi:WD40 repeat protein